MKLLVALALVALLGAFFLPMEFSVDREFWRTLMDVSHLPLFALITAFCFVFTPARLDRFRRCRNAFVAGAILSIAIELLQPFTGRSQSMLDQLYGIGGAAFGAFLLYIWPMRREPRIWFVAGLSVVIFCVAAVGPIWRKHKLLALRSEQFPVLGNFEKPDDFLLWRPNYYSYTGAGRYDWVTNFVTEGTFAMEVDASIGGWPGVDFDAGGQDWSGYQAWAFDLYNPGSDFILRMRIDDDGDCNGYGNRFDHELPVSSAWNNISIPMEEILRGPRSRELNLTEIRRVVIFISIADGPRKFFLDNIRLTKGMAP
jgi:hypothetical protein